MIRPQYHFRQVGGRVLIWDVQRLLRLAADLLVQDHPLGQIREIDEPYWFAATDDQATSRAVLTHARLIIAADLSYPIILCAEGRVMDGMHRVMKTLDLGLATVKARQFKATPPPDHVDVAPSDLPYQSSV